MKVRKAIIPAAGLGTRFLPATKAQAKEMLPIVDKPTIQYIIEEAVEAGIEDIVIITGRNKKTIEDHFDRSPELEQELERSNKTDYLEMVKNIAHIANVYYVRQKQPRGLGHAVLTAKSFIGDEPFAVLLGDSIVKCNSCTGHLVEVFEKYQKSTIAIREVPNEQVNRYGIISGSEIDEDIYKISKLVEKPEIGQAPTNLAIVGRYVLTPDIFDKIKETEAGFNDEVQLTDAISKLDEVYGVNYHGKVFNIENRIGWLTSSIDFALDDDEFKDDLIEYMKTFMD